MNYTDESYGKSIKDMFRERRERIRREYREKHNLEENENNDKKEEHK